MSRVDRHGAQVAGPVGLPQQSAHRHQRVVVTPHRLDSGMVQLVPHERVVDLCQRLDVHPAHGPILQVCMMTA